MKARPLLARLRPVPGPAPGLPAARDGATAVGAIRELGEALGSGPFRVALALSALAHLALLLGLRGVETVPRGRPPVRVHFVREAPGAGVSAPLPAARSLPSVDPGAPPAAPPPAAKVPDPPAAAATPAARPLAAPPPMQQSPVPRPAASVETAPAVPRETAAPGPLPEVREAAASVPPPPGAPADGASQGDAAPAATGTPAAPLPGDGTDEVGGAAPSAAAVAGTAAGFPGVAPAGGDGVAAPAAAPSGTLADGAAGQPASPSAQEIAALRRRIDARKVYPQIAIRNGWEGRVLVEMHLDFDGSLARVRLVAGSGYPVLDEATITAVRLASPFPPIARLVTVPVEYRLRP